MRRLIVTGPNGAGKSHFARSLAGTWPCVSVQGYDAIKLTRDWAQRPREESLATLAEFISGENWILEGGPSMLPIAMPRATLVVWLDPPLALRAWRLALRPWRNRGRTRAELPDGNADWVLSQYQFAWASLRSDRVFREAIRAGLAGADHVRMWHCRRRTQVDAALRDLAKIKG